MPNHVPHLHTEINIDMKIRSNLRGQDASTIFKKLLC